RLNPGAEVISRIFQQGKSQVFSIDGAARVSEDCIKKMLGARIPGMIHAGAFACIPLMSPTNKYGMLMFFRSGREAAYTRDDTQFFTAVSHMLTLAMKMNALNKSLKEMEAIGKDDQYKAGLISTLAHEMRTPLTSIKGYATALLMKETKYNEGTQREFLKIIDRECDILEDLIIDHLESSIIDAGMMKIDLQPVRLQRLAAKAADDIGRRYSKHEVLVDFAEDFPLVDADPDRILQVLRQLLDNAAKYSPGGGLIVLQGRIVDDKAVISVSDEGVGITPEDLSHLFDRFFRARSNSGAEIIGTGLGLPISRTIVEAHGGRIWAESQLGQGSKFCFNLPLKGPSQDIADE
ncbi:MAG: ATP-binding protein, partial [Dehalococcoidia bacterium]